ncbi:MAG TPA: hypothetical protein VHG72_15555, partial [Polyangia bacterium]|nr:hypothetical protein [Polyangia bacterium]
DIEDDETAARPDSVAERSRATVVQIGDVVDGLAATASRVGAYAHRPWKSEDRTRSTTGRAARAATVSGALIARGAASSDVASCARGATCRSCATLAVAD